MIIKQEPPQEDSIFYFVMGTLSVFFLVLILFLTSCNTINIIHSQGTASDLIDETQTANPNVPISLTSVPGVI